MRNPHKIIATLSPTDALSILKILAAGDENLANRIAEIALDHLSQVDPEEVGLDIFEDLDALVVEDVWDRAGSTSRGYIEPHEAAEEMVEEVLAPFMAELKKQQQLGLSVEAGQLCMGLLAGLYRFETESTNQFKDWAIDAPRVFAEIIIDAWQEGNPTPAEIKTLKTFVEERLGRWGRGLI